MSWAVIINNVAALEILLDCGYVRAALLAAVGAVCRAGVGWVSYDVIVTSEVLVTNMLCSAFYAQLVWEEALLLLALSRLGM